MRNSNVAKTIWGTEKAYDNDMEVGKTLVGGKSFLFLEERRIRKNVIKAYSVMNSTEKMHQEIVFSIS